MRKLLYAGVLLATTALYPSEANAMPPVLGFVGAIITALGAPALGGAVVGLGGAGALGGFAAGWSFATSLLGGALLNVALSIGISALAELLRPKPNIPTANPGGRLVNMRQAVAYFEHAYGVVRKGGPIAFWKAKDGRRFYDVLLAARRINGIRSWMADERETTVNENGFALNGSFYSDGRSRLRLMAFLGAAGQLAPALLMENFPAWTAAHNMAGLAHVVAVAENVKSEDFSNVWTTSREPVIAPVIEGYCCYDPRDATQNVDDPETWKFTTNAALIIADWIVSKDGLNRSVIWSDVAVEADHADTIVYDRNGNPLPKWQLGGAYSSADEREVVRAQMAVAADAFFYEGPDGTVGFYVGRFIEPDVEITDEDILSISYTEGQAGTDVSNAFSIQYTEAENGYRENASAPFVIDAPGEAYEEDSLAAYWIPNHNQAVRVAARLLRNSRAEYRVSIVSKYQGIRLMRKRFFRLRHLEFGLDRVFEIDKLSRNDDGITWTIEAHSTSAADFAFLPSDEPPKPSRIGLETSSEVPDPTGIVATVEPFLGSVAIKVAWDEPPRDTILHQIRYRVKTPVGEWSTISAPVGQNFQRIVGIADNETYEVQVRALLASGRGTDWKPDVPLSVTVLLNPVAPAALSSVAVVPGVHLGNAAFQIVTANDPNLYGINVYRTAAGGTFNESTDLIDTIPAPRGSTFGWIDGDASKANASTDAGYDTPAAHTLTGTGWSVTGSQAVKVSGSGAAQITEAWPSGGKPAVGQVIRWWTDMAETNGSSTLAFINRTTPGSGGQSSASINAAGVTYGRMTVTTEQDNWGFTASAGRTAKLNSHGAFIETAAMVGQGDWRYRFEPVNRSGLPGPLTGPVAVLVT